MIGGKIGDLIGRKRAYVIGLVCYAIGAVAMAQSLLPIKIFWAVIGGLGASLLLPAMQALIHGKFEGAEQKRVYALVCASAAIAAAVGPLLGGFITTFLSWRVAFMLEALIIAVVLSGIKLVRDVPDESIMMAIVTAAARGLSVGRFVSEIGDQSMVYHAQRSYNEALLRAGVRIYLYRAPRGLPSKHFTIDEEVAVIGSSTMDVRSFSFNMRRRSWRMGAALWTRSARLKTRTG